MANEEHTDLVKALGLENKLLKQRVFELEERLNKSGPVDSGQTHLRKLVEIRDKQVQQYNEELEKKNQKLQMWISALRLYQEIFENDPAIMIGVTKETKIVLFNKAAVATLGEEFKENINKRLADINFTNLDPQIPLLVEDSLKKGVSQRKKHKVATGIVETVCYTLGSGQDLRGALVKISIIQS